MIRLVIERQRHGWSQLQLAKLCDISPQDISALERGYRRPYPAWQRRLARAFGTKDERWLFEELDEQEVRRG